MKTLTKAFGFPVNEIVIEARQPSGPWGVIQHPTIAGAYALMNEDGQYLATIEDRGTARAFSNEWIARISGAALHREG